MPRAKKIAYDHRELKSMSRAQIQALAKQQGIRANGKTSSIIDELLRRDILTGKTALAAAGIPDAAMGAGDQRTKRKPAVQSQELPNELPTETGEPLIEPGKPSSQPGKPHIEPEKHSTGPKGSTIKLQELSFQPREPSSSTRPTRVTGTSPIVNAAASSSGPESLLQAQSLAPTLSENLVPHAHKPRDLNFVPMKHTEEDVRNVRRHITNLIDAQAAMRGEVDELIMLVDHLEEELTECHNILHVNSWRREAIEQTVLVPFKANRHLWDGTAHMHDNARLHWERYADVAGKEKPVRLMRSVKIPPSERVEDSNSVGSAEASEPQAGGNEDDDMEGFYV